MSGKLLVQNFDGSMERLEVLPEHGESKAVFHMRYWDEEGGPVEAVLTFYHVIAISFSVNYFDNPMGAELFGLYEIEDEAEKVKLIRENFRIRRREFLLAGYDGYDPEDENDLLNYTGELDRMLSKAGSYHLYQQQTQGGTYRLAAGRFEMEARHGPVGTGAGTVG